MVKKKRKTKKWKVSFTFKGQIKSKSNNTFWREGMKRPYIYKAAKDYEKALKEKACKVMKRLKKKPATGLVKIHVTVYMGDKRVRDIPNSPKSLCDALNKVVYEDDFQIHNMTFDRKLDRKNPRVVITVEKTKDSVWENG